MQENISILIVDDDKEIRKLLADFLVDNLFSVFEAENTKLAEQVIKEQDPDLMLLDLRMPGEDGAAFCRRIRDVFNKPIIMLTAVRDEIEEVVAHEVGVDDYLVKPYNHRILLAKIKSQLRRYENLTHLSSENISDDVEKLVYSFNNWMLNVSNRTLLSDDDILISLSSAEYQLLLAFIEHPKRVLTRDQLIDYTKSDSVEVFDRSIDVLISRLRRKLNDTGKTHEIIETVRGGGYMFCPDVTKQ